MIFAVCRFFFYFVLHCFFFFLQTMDLSLITQSSRSFVHTNHFLSERIGGELRGIVKERGGREWEGRESEKGERARGERARRDRKHNGRVDALLDAWLQTTSFANQAWIVSKERLLSWQMKSTAIPTNPLWIKLFLFLLMLVCLSVFYVIRLSLCFPCCLHLPLSFSFSSRPPLVCVNLPTGVSSLRSL